MKVGIYFPGYPPKKGGGFTFEQEILLALSEMVQHCPHELVFFFQNAPGEYIESILAAKGLMAVQLEPIKNLQRIYRFASKKLQELHLPFPSGHLHPLRAALEREKVELIWFVADSYIPVEELDAPYIATVWDIMHCVVPWFPEVSQAGMWQWREKFYFPFLRRAAYILTPNLVGQKELSLFYGLPPERFRVIPFPCPRIEEVPDEGKVNDVLARYALAGGYLFYPAGFWPHKNHANLLLALQALKNNYRETRHLVLVGSDKGNLEYIRELAKTLGLEEQVHFLDFVPRDDLIALYRGAFALAYLSLAGPANLPPLEAFQCGCPVIVSEFNGAREQLGDAALFVNGLDPEAIAKAVQELEHRPELRRALIEKGSRRAALYTGEAYIRDVFKIFDDFEPVRRTWGSG